MSEYEFDYTGYMFDNSGVSCTSPKAVKNKNLVVLSDGNEPIVVEGSPTMIVSGTVVCISGKKKFPPVMYMC